MQINFILNGTKVSVDVAADTLLLDLVRSQGLSLIHIWHGRYGKCL